jgi:hypothetical protein
MAIPPHQYLWQGLHGIQQPTLGDYATAAAEYVRVAHTLTESQKKIAQLALSHALARVLLDDLRTALGQPLRTAFAGEKEVGGGLRNVKADVSEVTELDGLKLAVEIKPVHLAVGRAIWNRFGDVRTFAVNIHLKYPFAVVGGVMTIPTKERGPKGVGWKSTEHLIERAVRRFIRAGGRKNEGEASHLIESIGVVVFDHTTGAVHPTLPPPGSGLRWDEFIKTLAETYDARFGM